ncbi:MAG TPA: fumarylacetoacetate hydrolase family protein [Geminicoccaceae bacterium]|nr:fumarylacetoacetate hydrolase family protein [Geminicoccus sp.]HMU48569.1 fumarylacetoacetate hydrolase family protein [Geminicoccaceae bacterium]
MADLAVEAGERLAHARRADQLIPALTEDEVPDIAAAYAVQRAAVAAWTQEPIGWKIGATSADTQGRLKVSGPFYGPIFAAHSHPSGTAVPGAAGLRGVEVELAFRLGRDLPAGTAYEPAEVAEAAAGLYLALEFVATRQEGGLEGRRAIADFGLNHAFVHGAAVEGWRDLDLAAIHAAVLVDGHKRAEGDAAVVLGSPLEALAWLAKNGPGLRAGQWISTGTLTGLLALPEPCTVTGDFGPLGRVTAQLT